MNITFADMHCDTMEKLYHGQGSSLTNNDLHININRIIQGRYLLQNFAVFIDCGKTEDPLKEALKIIDRYYQEITAVKDIIAPAFCFDDIINNKADGKISALLTIEDGAVIQGSLAHLRNFYRLGVRMMTLTWNYENEIGAPNLQFDEQGSPRFSARNPKGLTPFGIRVVEEMEALGMIPDVSHLSDGGFRDVVQHTKKPFVASHSNAAMVCNVCRNLTDEMIRAIAMRGGVIGINYCEDFLTVQRNPDACALKAATLAHIRHIIEVGGIEVCALGSDFDGIPGNHWLKDAAAVPLLAEALTQDGYTAEEIEKICCKNVLRVYREVL